MSTTTSGGGMSKLAPLVLRLSVAAIMGYAGYTNIYPPEPVLPAEIPASTETETSSKTKQPLPVTDDATTDSNATEAVADQDGVTIQADWPVVTGFLELVLSGVLLVGFLTRLTGLGLMGGAAYSMIASQGAVETASQSLLHQPVEVYQASPMGVMLLGAIGLTLLVSGCGFLGLDGLLFNRSRSSKAMEGATA